MTLRRRLTAILAATGLAASMLTAVPAYAAVPTDTCGGSVYVSPDVDIISSYTGNSVGKVQLRRDSEYKYWACVTFYSPVPTGFWGMARLYRFLDHAPAGEFNCDDGGGDHVSAGGRFCRTPKILAPSPRVTFWGEGLMYQGADHVAIGATGEVR